MAKANISFIESIRHSLKGRNASELVFMATAFSIPIWPQLTIGLTVLWMLIVVLKSSPAKILAGFNYYPHLKLSVLFYATILFGLIWTSNFHSAFKECMDDMYLLLFPIGVAAFKYSSEIYNLVKRYLSLGAFVASLICLSLGLFKFATTGDIHELFYIKFSKLLHPTYFGAILIFSLLVLFEEFKEANSKKRYFEIYVQIITLILLCSKVTYLTALVVLILRFFIALYKKERFLKFDLRNFILVTVTIVVFAATQVTQSRIPQLINALEKTEISTGPAPATADSSNYNSSTIRIAQARYSVELIKKNPVWGSGTGDVVDDFKSILVEHNDIYGIEHFRLPHNFYLHIMIMLGYPGLIISALFMFLPWIWAFRKKQYLLFEFLTYILIMGITDIFIHATLGAFFAFAYCLLTSESRKHYKESTSIY